VIKGILGMMAQPERKVDSGGKERLLNGAGRYQNLILLVIILVLASAVRFIGIDWGLPYNYFPDESFLVNHALAFGTGDLNPHTFNYPSLLMYVLFFVYGVSYVVGSIVGVFSSTDDLVRLFFNDATLFYLPGRVIAALSGVACVLMLYLFGKSAYKASTGLIAGIFLAFSVMHVDSSHYAKPHVPASLLVIVALWFCWRIYAGKADWRSYLLAGFFAGLGASTIYHAGFTAASVVVAHLSRWRGPSERREVSLLSPKLFGAGAACFFGFALGTPFAILDFSTFLSDIRTGAGTYLYGDFSSQGIFYPFTSLIHSIGSPTGIVVLLGLGYAVVKRRAVDLILLSQVVVLGAFFMMFPVKGAHHMLIAFPAACLLGGAFLVDVVERVFRPGPARPAILAGATLLIVILPAWSSLQDSLHFTLPDTRTLAKHWVEQNIPANSKLVMDSGKYYLSTYGPPLRMSRWTLEQLIARGDSLEGQNLARRDGNRRVGYSGECSYFREQLRLLDDQPGYDVIQILHDPASPVANVLSLEDYVSTGTQYAIVSSLAWRGYVNNNSVSGDFLEKAAKYRDFYRALELRGLLLKEFVPGTQSSGPILRVYALPKEHGELHEISNNQTGGIR
jgi:hypothetical protein